MRSFTPLIALIALCGIAPIAFLWSAGAGGTTAAVLLSIANLLGWSIVGAALVMRGHLIRRLQERATKLGLPMGSDSLLSLHEKISQEQSRKSQALSIDLVESRITSKEELSRALEKIVSRTFKVLEAEAAELVLFDKESGGYHSSFVLGRPMAQSGAELVQGSLLDEALHATHPFIAVQPISFAGTVLGSLSVELRKGRVPSLSDKELLKVLALQGTLAIVNSRYNDELLRMKRSSEESVRAKTGFLANLSHELRGPLGIILNAVEVVLEGLCGQVSSEQADVLKMVRQSGQHLLELLNDVLDYAKTESGTIAPDRVAIPVDELLLDITTVLRSQAQQKNHSLNYKSTAQPLSIFCDRRHIRQMMINLLTNAIKYTPPNGQIEVWAERVPGNRVKISVKDNGIGIESAQKHRVFAPFERVESVYTLKQSGTGLGMPLTRRLAELNGGLCDFVSVVGQGSEFWLILPASESGSTPVGVATESQEGPMGHGECIMLVGHNPEERSLLAKYLAHAGFEVSQAESSLQAIEQLRAGPPQLLLIGDDLPEGSEERFLQSVRAVPNAGSVPIVLLTSRAFSFDTERLLRLGVDRCLPKPIELPEMTKTIKETLRSRVARSESPPSSSAADASGLPKGERGPSDDLLH